MPNFDSGLLSVWRGENIASPGALPEINYKEFAKEYYAEITVGITRWYTAQQHGDRPDIVVQIPRRYDIRPATDTVILEPFTHEDGSAYKIIQLQNSNDDNNLPVTVLTLERHEGLDKNVIFSTAN